MSREEILAGIQLVACTHLGVTRELTPAMGLTSELVLDSLRRLTLIVELEDHFRICFEEGDEVGLETVGDIIELIAARLHVDPEQAHP